MNMNVRKTNNGKYLAMAMIIAMVVCAFVAFIPAQTDANMDTDQAINNVTYVALKENGSQPDEIELSSAGSYYISKEVTTLTFTGNYKATIYIEEGSNLEITTADEATVKVAKTVTAPTNGATTVSVMPYSGLAISSSSALSEVDVSTASANKYVSITTSDISTFGGTNTYGILVEGPETVGDICYATGSEIIVPDVDENYTISVVNGSVTASKGDTSRIVASGIQSAQSSTTFTIQGNKDGELRISGTITDGIEGSIEVVGKARTGSTAGVTLNDTTIKTVSSSDISGTNVYLADSISKLTSFSSQNYARIYGDITEDVTFTVSTGKIALSNGASFTGSITYNITSESDKGTYLDGTIIGTSGNVEIGNITSNAITITSDVQFGEITLSKKITAQGNTSLSSGNTMTFGTNGQLNIAGKTFTIGGDLFSSNPDNTQIVGALGTVKTYSSNTAFVMQYTDNASGQVDVSPWTETVSTAQQFIDAVESGCKDIVIANGTVGNYTAVSSFVLGTNCDVDYLELNGVKVTVYGTITVGGNENFTLVINESTITDGTITTESASMGTGKIAVIDDSSMEINHSGLFINVDAQTGSSVTSIDNYSTADSIPGSVMVGYGSNYTLSGSVISGQNVKVWGTLVVPENGTLTINSGAVVNTADGAVINVLGSMTVAGQVNIAAGAKADIDGTLTIANTNGNAQFNNLGEVTVDGTVVVSAPNTGMPANILKATDNTGSFTVNGTLNMNGTLAGSIQDKGTVTFNGVSSSAKIYVYNGVTFQVTSVSGSLEISDKGVAKDIYGDATKVSGYKDNVNVSDGNMVTLDNVKGVTVSVSIDSVVKGSQRYVYSDMYVSGTMTLINDKVSGANNVVLGIDNAAPSTINGDKGQIFIDAAVTLGKNLDMSIAGTQAVTVTSNGTVSVTGEGASFSNGGTLTVDGTVTIGAKCNDEISTTAVNAVRFTVTDQSTGDVVKTYTNFASALDSVDTADSKTVYALGTVKVTADDTVAAGQTVQVSGTLEISKDVTLTVDNGGKVSGGTAAITVKGTFTSANFLADIGVRTITADVVIDDAPARTYTSLANALANAGEGDVITLNGNVIISENTSIPTGVTVKSGHNVNITENAVLSVAGTLDISAKGSLTNNTTADYVSATDRLGAVTVSGTVAVVGEEPDMLEQVSGAHYSKSVGAVDTYYVSSLSVAAKNVDQNISATITVIGTVTADSVEFTAPEGFGVLTIRVNDIGEAGDDKVTVVSVGTMTLDGVKLSIAAGASYSGTVTAAAAGSTASVELDRAGGVVIESVGIEGTEGVTDYLAINSGAAAFTGTVEISSGTVTVANVTGGTALAAGTIIVGGENSRMTVASDATLSVRTGSTVTASSYGKTVKSAGLTVEGTMDVKGTLNVRGIVDILGTLNVAEFIEGTGIIVAAANTSEGITAGVLNIMGALNVSDELGKEGAVSVANIMTVGSKPTALGAAGTVTGEVTLTGNGYVKVYSGTAGDIIDGAAAAESTALYINGALYMTVYGNGDIEAIVLADDIDLAGLTTPANDKLVIYTDEACKNAVDSADVGDYEALYMKFDSSYVYGTVSQGTGFTLFIDGVPANAYYGAEKYPLTVGTHTVSYDVKAGYDGSKVQLTFNGQAIESGATIEITAGMDTFTIAVTGAVPATSVSGGSSDDGLGLTDYLLIILVVLIVVMAIMVALRLMRS